MPRKPLFPTEPVTRPDRRAAKGPVAHRSGPAPKDVRERAEAPTLPPNTAPQANASERARRPGSTPRNSGVQGVKPRKDKAPAATVDEVTADLSKDPRRERDDDANSDDDENGDR